MFEVQEIAKRLQENIIFHSDPFPMIQVQNIFTAEEYEALFSDLLDWAPSAESNYEKKTAGLEVYDFPKKENFKKLTKAMSQDLIRDTLFAHFGVEPFGKFGATVNRDFFHYHLGPHLDYPVRRLTLQIYLPKDLERVELGTVFGSKNEEGIFIPTRTLPYAPNSGYAFVSGLNTWHSLPKFEKLNSPRYSLLFRWKDIAEAN